jgi:hypothetical protein
MRADGEPATLCDAHWREKLQTPEDRDLTFRSIQANAKRWR